MIPELYNQYIENSIKENWTKNAFRDYDGGTFTYAEVGKKITELHACFKNIGIQKGDKVALIGKNSANWAISYLAVTTYGAVIVPLLVDFKVKDIENIVNHSDAKILIADDRFRSDLDMKNLPLINLVLSLHKFGVLYTTLVEIEKCVENASNKTITVTAETFKLPALGNDSLLAILYTSGTSGFSKGVILNHNSLATNIRYAQENMPLKRGDSILSFLPLAHAYGCAFEFLFPFSKGCFITFLGKMPAPAVIIKAFNEIKPQLILSVPLIIEKVYKSKIKPVISKPAMKIMLQIPILNGFLHKKINKSLSQAFGGEFKEIVIGGAALNKEVEDFLTKIKFRFATGYGMTEFGPLISYRSWDKRKIYSTGKKIDYIEVKIEKEDPNSEIGEICLRGENQLLGYYKNDEITNAVIDSEGWVHTGDLGETDAEGNIWIKGRSKNMILGASGQNIYPEEIEAPLSNFPYIQECLIVERDQKLVALIVPDENLPAEVKANLNQIYTGYLKQLNHDLPTYMNVAKFEIRDIEFEKTAKRSIKRFLYS